MLQFEEAIALMCNGLHKILKNQKIHYLEKYKRIIHGYKPITIEKNQKIKSLQIIENICACGYITEKYKRKMCYTQNNNS